MVTKKTPDWVQLQKMISKKYGEQYVEDNLLGAKVSWYRYKKDALNFTKYLTQQTDKSFRKDGIPPGVLAIAGFNNSAMEVFQYDNNPLDLKKALTWETELVDKAREGKDPVISGLMDTKASLLYKIGKKAEAIKIEEEAILFDPNDPDMRLNLTKMKKGDKIWPDRMP
jgi:hypothetical protein